MGSLSLGKRESDAAVFDGLPLPLGEGWGEGSPAFSIREKVPLYFATTCHSPFTIFSSTPVSGV